MSKHRRHWLKSSGKSKRRLCPGALESTVGDVELKSSGTDGDSCRPSEEPQDQPPATGEAPDSAPLSPVRVLVDDVDAVDRRCCEQGHADGTLLQSSYCAAADTDATVLPVMPVPLAACTDPWSSTPLLTTLRCCYYYYVRLLLIMWISSARITITTLVHYISPQQHKTKSQ